MMAGTTLTFATKSRKCATVGPDPAPGVGVSCLSRPKRFRSPGPRDARQIRIDTRVTMHRRSRLFFATLALFVGVGGCLLADADTNSLSMAVTATPLVVPVGTIVTVMTDATGQSLWRTVIEYGDG
ncbi:MAG: hypothetical protein ACI9OJ_004866, partial [Myxococcota bacterium]